MSSYQNMTQCNDEDEISIAELFQMVFNHFFMIVGIVLLFCVLGVCCALFLVPDKHDVEAAVYIRPVTGTSTLSKYGIEYYSAASIVYNMLSKSSLESVIPSGSDVKITDLEKTLSCNNIKNTDYWVISASDTKDSDFYVSLISSLVDKQILGLSSYRKSAASGRSRIESAIAELNRMLSSAEGNEERVSISDRIASAENELMIVDNYINALDSAITWTEMPVIDEENTGTSKAMVCIAFFLVGGVIGVAVAWIIDFSDKHIYSSSKLLSFIDSRKLLSSVPLYRDSSAISPLEFSYISSKISPDHKNIIVTSVSDKAGKSLIADGLRSSSIGAAVTEAESVTADPAVFDQIKSADYALIVLRAGIDTFISLDKLISDLNLTSTDYGFVFNCVDVSDRNTNRYKAEDAYIKHKWLTESWHKFYKRNYR